MLLTKSISNTKKFFQKGIDSLKSFFSGDQYQKLPKAHPYPDSSHSKIGTNINSEKSFKNQDLDRFCGDLSGRWRSYDEEKEKKAEKKKTRSSPSPTPSSAISTTRVTKQERNHDLVGNFMRYSPANPAKNFQVKTRADYKYNHNKQRNVYAGKNSKQENNSGSKDNNTIEARSLLVAQQLRDLQKMDANNVDHELDIEEVLYYYSRLTCPAYVELVDKFFMEIYAEHFGPPVTPLVTKSRQLVR